MSDPTEDYTDHNERNARLEEAVETIAATMDETDLWQLTWKLMDRVGICLALGLDRHDIRERMEEDEAFDGVEITDDEIDDAMLGVCQQDLSHFSTALNEEVMDKLIDVAEAKRKQNTEVTA